MSESSLLEGLIGTSHPTLDSLSESSRWVAWREEERAGKPTKVPYQPARSAKAQSTNPATWGPRELAQRRSDTLKGNGVGIMLGSADGLTLGGLDLDSCRDMATGAIEPWAAAAIERFASYAEVSPSGTGVKVFFSYRPDDAAAIVDKARVAFSRGAHCEMALDLTARYYAVTGQRLVSAPRELRPVDVTTLRWFVDEAGPAFKGTPESDPIDRSAVAYGIAAKVRREGGGRAEFEEALAEDPRLADWAADARQVKRAWERAPDPLSVFDFDDLPPLKPARDRLRFLAPAECEASPSRGYIVKGLLAPGDVGCIYGAPGAGKSLISPHIGYQVARGERAFGMRTRAGCVFYVAPEDPHGLRGRVTALKLRHGDAPSFFLVEGLSDLLSPDSADLAALRAAVTEREPVLIFLDTLAASFPGLEENTAEDMGRVVAVARSLAEGGAAVVLIHHDTKAQSPTPRGHSVLNGALDVALQLFPKDQNGIVRGSLTKNRNGPCDLDIAFRIALQDLGDDDDGDPIRLALVDELSGPAPRRERLPASSAAALGILRELRAGALGVTEAEWRDACVEGRSVSASDDRASRRKAMDRAFADLARRSAIELHGGLVAPVDEGGLGSALVDAFDEIGASE